MDEGTERAPGSLSGDVVPSGPGEWVTHRELAAREKVTPKAIYRRVQRGQMTGRGNPVTGAPEVWVPLTEAPGSLPEKTEGMGTGLLTVPETGERFLRLMEQATASMARLEEVARENGELKERAAQLEHAVETYRREYEWLKTELKQARKPWWQRWQRREQ